MGTAKLDFFVAKYRAADAAELTDLMERASSLADEAQAALRQVAGERGIELRSFESEAAQTLSNRASRSSAIALEEGSYSITRVELINLRMSWFLWSIPIAIVAGFMYRSMAPEVRDTFLALPVALVGFIALVWPLYCVYKLSRAVDPKRSVAWTMVVACLVPILGWIAPISLVLKANRIKKATAAARAINESSGSI